MSNLNPDDNQHPDDLFHLFSASAGRGGMMSPNMPNVDAEELQRVFQRALGDVPVTCPHCEGFCADHTIRLRDALFRRGRELAQKLADGLDLYHHERAFGISDPEELIAKLYEIWFELFILYTQTEPQEVFQPEEVPEDLDEEPEG